MEPSRGKNNLTPPQQRAVAARGNVLVMAGAGTGKTHALVERCLNLLCEERASLDEILIVTFTEAAATEMRRRLRAALGKKSQENSDPHFAGQLMLFDAAHIGTLHAFCFKLVREHFYELGLDPQISILDEGETRLLAGETLGEQFNSHYENKDTFSIAVRDLIKMYGDGSDEKIRALVLRLHNYIQTRADAEKWLEEQIEIFSAADPVRWHEWFRKAVSDWHDEWLPALENLSRENPKAAECLEILKSNPTDAFQKILAAGADWPRGAMKFRKPLGDFFDGANFLGSLIATGKEDPLAEDWGWICVHMKTLLRLTREFAEEFSARKRTAVVLDFHDLEQFALKLLWNFDAEKPAEIARRWREKLRFVFVDEYQDINAAQDKIISALSRDGADANRFLVGDVKQSIYRFRLADPKIFRGYARHWRGKNGQMIPLTDNFRSRESLLNFVNSVFELLMREEVGGVSYDGEAKLKFGSPETRAGLSLSTPPEPRAELLLRFTQKHHENSGAENDDLADLEESEKEARLLAMRLLELKNSRHEIWDDDAKNFRAVEWRDMAILLRAPSGKAEIFAKQFERARIPLVVERGGFYDSSEILDLLSVLQLLDNPLQDVPVIAVLRSPLVGLSLDELAQIRLTAGGHFWFALNQSQNPKSKIQGGTREKIEGFLERFSCWRKIARQDSLSQCLQAILAETHYDTWIKSRPRAAQQHANIERFLNLAQKFDRFQQQGLFRFLKFVVAQREMDAEPEVAPAVDGNAVRLMSIHQSKGLEFPVVAVADLAKNFNTQDFRGEIIFDGKFGLCPKVKPPQTGRSYPGLSYWLARQRQRRELAGEELRLLYVALTRARDTLILTGSMAETKWETFSKETDAMTVQKILAAKSYADWLGLWFAHNAGGKKELPDLRWRIAEDAQLVVETAVEKSGSKARLPELDNETRQRLHEVVKWNYEFESATKRAAKSSVTALRRQVEESNGEAEQVFDFRFSGKQPAQRRKAENGKQKLSATAVGEATHKFLQHLNFEGASDLKSLEAEARRLKEEKVLSSDECAVLNLENVAAFWGSDFGEKILANAAAVKREFAFTARFSPAELDGMLKRKSPPDLEKEFIVVQGVADLVVMLPREIWLLDFKTDEVRAGELVDRTKMYAPQLKLYASALERIYSRPVTDCRLHFLSAQQTAKI